MNTTELFESGRKKARIEIIPLIDVIFFLLATFVLFTLSLDKLTVLNANLPKTPPNPLPPSETMVSLQATDGGLYWKQGTRTAELVSFAELPARLAQYKKSIDDPKITVRGDNQAKFGAAVSILDVVREAGISQVAVETLVSKTGS